MGNDNKNIIHIDLIRIKVYLKNMYATFQLHSPLWLSKHKPSCGPGKQQFEKMTTDGRWTRGRNTNASIHHKLFALGELNINLTNTDENYMQ